MAYPRKLRFELRRQRQAETRVNNTGRKAAERDRRDVRMLDKIRAGKPPYTPDVMSWLSAKLGKRARALTDDDIAGLTRDLTQRR